MRILVVEDAPDLARAIRSFLSREGHAVDLAESCAQADAAMAVAEYDGVVLDLGLPDRSGLELLRLRRKAGDRTPIIIATARDQISDRIAGLDMGADDYMVKPFDLGELTARLRAHSRRAEGDPDVIARIGDLQIDRARATVRKADRQVRLTAREWAILDALLASRGRLLTRNALEERLYAFDAEISGNAVEVYISRLRKKLGPKVITTRRGLGYQIA